ncbi:hypothetical protein NZK32_03920 [Cyanobium sp. FGCU-52]|nr:hypothetical protein [Cyanobium sp. FGCU52]
MACPKCGCRMVAKVGSGSSARLVCTDCGRPVDATLLAEERGRRLRAALFLALLALGGALLFLLGSMTEQFNGGPGVEEGAPAAGEERGSSGEE